ncbi:MAG TPA: protein kinase, partial [Rhabdochlamydiaceae bacterium]
SIGKQSLEALARLRKIGVIHGDLKPENMAYSQLTRHLTILDWGCGIQVKQPVYLEGIMQTCFYRAPEVILGGLVDPSADLWSLACVLYEQFTGELIINCADDWDNQQVSNNMLLHKIAFQIGMPSTQFLNKCGERSCYFNYERDYEFNTPLNFQDTHWRVTIAKKGLERNLDADQVAEFTQLLEMMLQYDNRPLPEELLKLPIFKKDISIHITSSGANAETVIYRAEDVDAYLAFNTAIKPTPVLELKQSAKRHTCHHLPAPGEHIFCSKATPLSQGMKRVRLLEDSTIDASLFQDTVFLWPEPLQPMTEDDSLPQLFGEIAEFL